MSNLYTDDSIQSLPPREFTRLRPGVYCGSTEYSTQLLIEIVSNAIDEWSIGHGDIINVDYKDDGSCRVEDFAQGFPVNSMREDGKTVLQASFDVLNTSGKFSDDGVYEGNVLGLNGIGSKLTNFLSNWLDVFTYRDGKSEHIHFIEGKFDKREVGKQGNFHTGTIVEWKPSKEFFTHTEIDVNRIQKLFHTLTCLCKGLTINLTHNGKDKIVYNSKNGLNDLVDDLVKDTEIIKNRLNIDYAEGKNKLNFVLTYTTNYSLNMVSYVNVGETDSGPHITQIKTAITREFNKFFKEKGWLKEKDANLEGGDIQEGMVICFNITSAGVSYDAQTKSRIVKLDMTPFTPVLTESIQNWLTVNEKEIKIVFDKAISARKAREAAKKARDAARNVQPKDKKKKFLDMPTKLVDCWGKDRTKCELLITEGDSAANGLVDARDSEIHAILPVRGKVIAAYKNSLEKILANQEVQSLIKALDLDLDPVKHRLVYDTKKLRYGKILLCADADPDGASIRNLLIELIWWLCPELITNGHVYTTMPPLFRITTKKNEYIYLKDAAALESYKSEHQGEKFLINRNKGLGEQDSEELAEALLNVDTRNVFQLTVEDEKKAAVLIETLLGPSVPPRRAYLLEHAEEANDCD